MTEHNKNGVYLWLSIYDDKNLDVIAVERSNFKGLIKQVKEDKNKTAYCIILEPKETIKYLEKLLKLKPEQRPVHNNMLLRLN